MIPDSGAVLLWWSLLAQTGAADPFGELDRYMQLNATLDPFVECVTKLVDTRGGMDAMLRREGSDRALYVRLLPSGLDLAERVDTHAYSAAKHAAGLSDAELSSAGVMTALVKASKPLAADELAMQNARRQLMGITMAMLAGGVDACPISHELLTLLEAPVR